MKKTFTCSFLLIICLGLFASCSKDVKTPKAPQTSNATANRTTTTPTTTTTTNASPQSNTNNNQGHTCGSSYMDHTSSGSGY